MWSKFIVRHRHRRCLPAPPSCCRVVFSSAASIATSSSPALRYDRDTGIIYVEDETDSSSSKTVANTTTTRAPLLRPLYQTVIGIEIHAQLLVPTKLFSSAPTRHRHINNDDIDTTTTPSPNEHVHAIDLAYPGTLPQPISIPTINASLLSAIVLNCYNIHTTSRFERKHYFYADLPQGYQITQQRWPIAQDGLVVFDPHVAATTRLNVKSVVDSEDNGGRTLVRRRGMRNRKEQLNGNDGDEHASHTSELIESQSIFSSSTISSHPDRHPVSLRIERIQIEQDTGRTIVGSSSSHYSHVDHNRTGCALIEIVSHPDLRSAHEAAGAVSRIRKLLQMAQVCDGKMEEGSLRCDLNVSIAPIDTDHVDDDDEHDSGAESSGSDRRRNRLELPPNTGHRVEVKNLNSIRQIIAATEYEALRQSKLSLLGTPTGRETRTLIVGSGGMEDETICIRAKGDALDYRFMPEPDLPPLVLDEETLGCTLESYLDKLRIELGESPEDAASRLVQEYGLTVDVAAVITGDSRAILLFEETVKYAISEFISLNKCDADGKGVAAADDSNMLSTLSANWLCNDLFALLKSNSSTCEGNSQSATLSAEYCNIDGLRLGALIALVAHGAVTSTMARKILNIMVLEGSQDHPKDIATANGWQVITDMEALLELCNKVVFDPKNSSQLEQYMTGEERKKWKIEKYFSGKIMAASRGNAHPELMKEALSVVLQNACSVS